MENLPYLIVLLDKFQRRFVSSLKNEENRPFLEQIRSRGTERRSRQPPKKEQEQLSRTAGRRNRSGRSSYEKKAEGGE